jgi:L-ascorbate metabolism protein UlaG (beta-lactamase superfamily)
MTLHLLLPSLGILLTSALVFRALRRRAPAYAGSAQFRHDRFENTAAISRLTLWTGVKHWWAFLVEKPANTVPAERFEVARITPEQLAAASDGTLWRLGHSTLLLKLAGGLWLTDPVLSERASPVGWAGPARFHAPPISADDLPPLAGVILSHDHYDHLDRATVLRLASKTALFVTPLGVGERLIAWGVDPAQVRQLDWWQSIEAGGLRLVATPAQHFSGRGLDDANRTLWASWVILGDGLRLFFSGDTGYFDGFRQIGERYGPFDMSFIECGAYDRRWPDVHMQPEQSLQAHLDLRARWLLPVHNGSFELGLHVWTEPMERISELANAAGAAWTMPRIGSPVDLRHPEAGGTWWRELG